MAAVLTPTEFTMSCPAPGVPEGPLRFSALERFGVTATDLSVSGGTLSAKTELPEGEGDIVVGGVRVARLSWSDAGSSSPASGLEFPLACTVTPVPLAAIQGVVTSGSTDRGVAGVQVTGCGATATTDTDGSYVLDVPSGRTCQLRAIATTGSIRWATGEGTAPATVDLVLDAPRTEVELRDDVEKMAGALRSALSVQEQLAAAFPQQGTEDVDRIRHSLDEVDRALESGDSDALREAWLSAER